MLQVYWESRRQAKALEYEVTCRLPGGLLEVVPVLLAEPSGAEGGAPPGGNQEYLRQSAGVAQHACIDSC